MLALHYKVLPLSHGRERISRPSSCCGGCHFLPAGTLSGGGGCRWSSVAGGFLCHGIQLLWCLGCIGLSSSCHNMQRVSPDARAKAYPMVISAVSPCHGCNMQHRTFCRSDCGANWSIPASHTVPGFSYTDKDIVQQDVHGVVSMAYEANLAQVFFSGRPLGPHHHPTTPPPPPAPPPPRPPRRPPWGAGGRGGGGGGGCGGVVVRTQGTPGKKNSALPFLPCLDR